MGKDLKRNRKIIHNYLPQWELVQKDDKIQIQLRLPHIGYTVTSVPGLYDQPLSEETIHRVAWRQIVSVIDEAYELIHREPEEVKKP